MGSEEGVTKFSSRSTAFKHHRLIRSGLESLLYRKARAQEHNDHQHYRSRYAVQVHNLSAIELVRVEGRGHGIRTRLAPELERADRPGTLYKQLEKAAVRSLYTLGLDAGEVILTSCGERKYGAERITPASRLMDRRLIRMYAAADKQLERMLQQEEAQGFRLMMGMDPEFVLVDLTQKKLVPASDFLDRDGEVGCDAVRMDGITTYPIAELRPEPSEEPRGLLVSLMHTMNRAGKLISDRSLVWQAGGMPYPGFPLGGHLHFSGIVLTSKLLRALDNYVTLPVSLLEDAASLSRRPRYGYLGDFRRQPHGGFEYRTLPSFLVSPALTKGIVYLSYLVVLNYKKLSMFPLDEERLHRAYYRGQRDLIRDEVKPLLAEVQGLAEYPAYARYIEPLFKSIARGATWDEGKDIRPLWKIPAEP